MLELVRPVGKISRRSLGVLLLACTSLTGPRPKPTLAAEPPHDLTSELAQTEYTIGDIPDLTSRGQVPLSFRVISAILPGPRGHLNVVASPVPKGSISIDSDGKFLYVPHADDFDEIALTFTAFPADEKGDRVDTQTVNLARWVQLPGEMQLINPPQSGAPDAQSAKYVKISVRTEKRTASFNTVTNRTIRNVEISGKVVVFEHGHLNGLHERFHFVGSGDAVSDSSLPNSDIGSLVVKAERVVIRHRLHLPQCNVAIYAAALVFEDKDPAASASLDTTPLAHGKKSADANIAFNGETAGDISLNVLEVSTPKEVTNSSEATRRFILMGGRGQEGKPGAAGAVGPTLKDYFPKWSPPGNDAFSLIIPKGTVAIFAQTDGHLMAGTKDWPDGNPGIRGGPAGNGGSGGNVVARGPAAVLPALEQGLKATSDLRPGPVGIKPAPALGGDPGTPSHALWVEAGGRVLAFHDAVRPPSKDAPEPDADTRGRSGAVTVQEGRTLNWLQPAALVAIISFIKDAYLNNQIVTAYDTVTLYAGLLDDASLYPSETSADLGRISAQISLLKQRLEANVDYYGNPPGWVPLLSFQVDLEAYRREIADSLPVLFLAGLVSKSAADLTTKITDIQEITEQASASVRSRTKEYNEAEDLIPSITEQILAMERQQAELGRELSEKAAELRAQASTNISQRRRAAEWNQAIGVISTAAKVIPIGQPALGVAGTAIGGLAQIKSDPAGGIQQLVSITDAFSDSNSKKTKTEFDKLIATVDPEKSSSKKTYIKGLIDTAKDWQKAGKQIGDAAKEAGVTDAEIEVELKRIEAQTPEFIELTDRVRTLADMRSTFTKTVNALIQTVGKAADDILTNLRVLDQANGQMDTLKAGLDHDTLLAVSEMQQQAKDRLAKYAYYLVKSAEYQLLEPVYESTDVDYLVEHIRTLVDSSDAKFLSSPENFRVLSAVCVGQLSQIAFKAFNHLISQPPKVKTTIKFSLSTLELEALNARGRIRINVGLKGLIDPTEANARALSFRAVEIVAHTPDKVDVADLSIIFFHSGNSTIQALGRSYFFRHYASAESSQRSPIAWTTRYDVAGQRDLRDDVIARSEIDLLKDLLISSAASSQNTLISASDESLYAHPGLWADVDVQRSLKPSAVSVVIDRLVVEVAFEYNRVDTANCVLQFSSSTGAATMALSIRDLTGKKDGRGTFRRLYRTGLPLQVVAQNRQGALLFKEWRFNGVSAGPSPELNITTTNSAALEAVYERVGNSR